MPNNDHQPELLIATTKDSEVAFAQAAANACQIPLKIFRTTSDAIQKFGDNSILIVDLDLGETITPPNLPLNQVHLLAMDTDFRAISRHFGDPPYGHFILRKVPDMALSDGQLYSRIIHRFFHANFSGLEGSGFSRDQIEVVNFSGLAQKKFAATSVGYFLMERGFNEQVSGIVSMAVDELLMNAMIDAPSDSDAAASMSGVHMEVGLDGDVLAVNVVDTHGSLDRVKLMKHLSANFGDEANEVRTWAKRGAGLGITQIMRAGGSLLFKVIPGKRTDATVFFRRAKTREIRKQAQFVATLKP